MRKASSNQTPNIPKTLQSQPGSNFPKIASKPGTNIFTFPYGRKQDEEEDLDRTLSKAYKRKLMRKEIESFDDGGPGKQGAKDEKAWILDPNTKEPVEVGPEDGQLTYAQALFHSANAQGKQGEIEKMRQMVGLFNELKGNKDDGGLKQFRVNENNLIEFDPAGGSMTLAEARSMADANRRALVPKDNDDNRVSREVFEKELENRDLRHQQEMQKMVGEILNKPSAVRADQNGKLTIDWNANPTGAEIMAWMMSQQLENQKNNKQNLYPVDSNGHMMPLQDFLELKRFDREEKRQDERTNALRDIGATLREHAGTVLAMAQEFISFMKGEQTSADSLKGTGWEEPEGNQGGASVDENAVRQKVAQEFIDEFGMRRFSCSCGNQVLFTKDMTEATCSQCGQVIKPQKEGQEWTSENSSEETTPSSSEEQSRETPSLA